jgi:hypothetical protein
MRLDKLSAGMGEAEGQMDRPRLPVLGLKLFMGDIAVDSQQPLR